MSILFSIRVLLFIKYLLIQQGGLIIGNRRPRIQIISLIEKFINNSDINHDTNSCCAKSYDLCLILSDYFTRILFYYIYFVNSWIYRHVHVLQCITLCTHICTLNYKGMYIELFTKNYTYLHIQRNIHS